MATIGTISAALKLVDRKKENLRKAFEDLQSQSHFLSSFNLTWSDLDSHFSSLQSSLDDKFILLQSVESKSQSQSQPQPQPQPQSSEQQPSTTVPARPELKSLIEKMDGVGLLRYLIEHRTDRNAIKVELPDAYRSAPDAAAMVLNAMKKFYSTETDLELDITRRNCIGMLEDLMGIKPEVSTQVRVKAMKLAFHWKERIRKLPAEDKPLGILGFLHLVAVYNLAGFDMDELIDYVITICKRRQAIYLCRAVIPDDRISDLIQKLIDNDNKLVAVKFSYEFKKTDKFPLVPLLKEYRRESSKLFMELRNNGKASLRVLNEAKSKEIGSLRSIIKCIEDYHLESDYPKHTLLSLVEKLEKEKTNKKRPATAPVPKPENPKTSKLLQTAAPAGQRITPKSGPNVFPLQQPQVQAAGFLPDLSSQYVNQTGLYVMAGASHAITYTGSNASPNGYGGSLGFDGNPTSTGPNLYPSEVHTTGGPLGFNGNATSTGPNLYPSEAHTTGGPLGFNDNTTSTGPNLYPSEPHTTGGPLGFNGISTSTGPNLYPSELHPTGGPLGLNGNPTSSGPNVYPSELHTTEGHLGFNGNPTSIGPNLYPSEQHTIGGTLGFHGNPTSTVSNLYPSEPHTTGGTLGFNGNSTSDGSNLYLSELHPTGEPLGFNGNSTSTAPNSHPPEQLSSGYYNMPVQYDQQTPSSGYYNMPVQYDGYNVQPQYHQPYYPQ